MDYGILMMLVVVFLTILAVLWLILPFAVFGIKNRLDKLIKQNSELINLHRR